MKTATFSLLLVVLVVVPVHAQPEQKWWERWFGDDAAMKQQIQDDEKLLQDAKLPTDAKGLLEVLRHLTPSADDEKKIGELFEQLDSANFKVREKATVALIAIGPKAIPMLKRLLPGTELEVRMRAERCLKALEAKSPAALAAAAVRLIKVRAPAGAVPALLQFAAHSPDEFVNEEILDAVYTLGVRQGKLDPALDAALKDAMPARRAIAAVLLGRFGSDTQRELVGKLLDDKNLEVRFRAAQGLLAKGDRSTLTVLVQVLKEAPYGLAERAEEILVQVAAATAPKAGLGTDEAARMKCYEGWRDWLVTNQNKVDLTKVDLGFPLPSPDFRARDVTRQLLDLLLKPKEASVAKVARITDIPFYQDGGRTVNTRQEWEAELKQNEQMPEGIKFKFAITKVEPLTDYLPKAKGTEKDFLAKFSPAEVRVVQVFLDIDLMGNKISGTLPIFVRVSGARGRIFGFGQPQFNVMKN
jgi:HEAT repeat protein